MRRKALIPEPRNERETRLEPTSLPNLTLLRTHEQPDGTHNPEPVKLPRVVLAEPRRALENGNLRQQVLVCSWGEH